MRLQAKHRAKSALSRKFTVVVLLCFFLSVNITLAQHKKVFKVGVKTGITTSNIWQVKPTTFHAYSNEGFMAGVFTSVTLGNYVGLQLEISVTQKGLKGTGTLLGSSYSLTRTTTYVDFPLLIQLKPVTYLSFFIGPQYAVLAKSKTQYTFNQNADLVRAEFNKEQNRKHLLGLVAGVDIHIKHVVLSARIGWDLQNNNTNKNSVTPDYRNKWIALCLGYSF
ncbi:MAG: porin family protein [Chryseotalea sp.]